MAKYSNTKATLFFNLAFILSLFLVLSVAESNFFGFNWLTCKTVHGVINGETCSSIQKEYNLTTQTFNNINPNIACSTLYIGQWICVNGTNFQF